MEVMSDFELHSLCRDKYYLNKYCLQTEAVLNSGKFKKLDELLPVLKEKVRFISLEILSEYLYFVDFLKRINAG